MEFEQLPKPEPVKEGAGEILPNAAKGWLLTALQFVVLLIGLAVGIIIAIGVTFGWEALSKWEVWLSILLSAISATGIWWLVYSLGLNAHRHNPDNDFCKEIARFRNNQRLLNEHYNFKELDEAVDRHNQCIMEDWFNRACHRISRKLHYNNLDDYDLKRNEYGFAETELSAIKALQSKKKKGDCSGIRFTTAEYLLSDPEKGAKISGQIDNFQSPARRSDIIKTVAKFTVTVLFGIIGQVLGFTFQNPNIWTVILTYGTIYAITILWAYLNSISTANSRAIRLSNKSRFLENNRLTVDNGHTPEEIYTGGREYVKPKIPEGVLGQAVGAVRHYMDK